MRDGDDDDGPDVDDYAPDAHSDGEGSPKQSPKASPQVAPGKPKPEYTVSDALALTETGQEEVMRMHRGGLDANMQSKGWQGLGDSRRWMALRKQAPAKKASGTKAKAESKRDVGIDFGMFDHATGLPVGGDGEEADAYFKRKLSTAKSTDALLLARGKERRRYNDRIKLEDDDEPVFPEDFFDATVFTNYYKQNKFLLPEDHMVTTNDFFKLDCMPSWTLIQKRRLKPAVPEMLDPSQPNAPGTQQDAPAGFGDHLDVYEDLPAVADAPVEEHDDALSPAGDAAFFDVADEASDAGDEPAAMDGGAVAFADLPTQECVQNPLAAPAGEQTQEDSNVLFHPTLLADTALPPPQQASDLAESSFSPTPELSAFKAFADLPEPNAEVVQPHAQPHVLPDDIGSLVFGDDDDSDLTAALTAAAADAPDPRMSVDANGIPFNLASHMELIAKPKEVAKINIQFAKKAKVVDIKKLKDTMWERLVDHSGGTEADLKGKGVFKVQRILFTDLVSSMQDLVAARNIAANTYEVSIAMYFISLLHLWSVEATFYGGL
eukprot:TRINITY_DN9550_c2_g2_i2.p1 TRINITY_DN9550_c2_g2~~TRINITY_DN9550_c2_g2_i2.p1  ORF type:complete len:633 (+),score=269.81 TRINITY_DN9550_c2_g2_i2:255-1901(+)